MHDRKFATKGWGEIRECSEGRIGNTMTVIVGNDNSGNEYGAEKKESDMQGMPSGTIVETLVFKRGKRGAGDTAQW